ncbi:MAG: DUF4136 domain-containing protein [Novosphingobium sp.]
MSRPPSSSPARLLKMLVVPLVLAALAACTSSLNTRVSRFNNLPPPNGQTIAVVPDDPALAGGIEFGQYARGVEDRLAAVGYRPVASPQGADLVARLDYGIDKGRERIRSSPGYRDPFWRPWYGYGPRWGYSPRFGPRFAGAWGYGWYDPWFDNDIESYTVYTSDVTLKIERSADGQRLFEGKAEAVSTSNRLQYLVPNLVEALFTGFPGNSGETVRITVAPEKTAQRR